jgi:type IV pilus assembly protein PilC
MATFPTGDGHADEFSDPETAPRSSDRLLATQGALNALAAEVMPAHERRRVLRVAERWEARANDSAWALTDTAGLGVGDTLREVARSVSRRSERALPWMLFYRLFLAGLGFLLIVLISLFVSPIFENMFREFGMRLPWLTESMLGLGRWIRFGLSYAWILVLIAPVAVALIRFGTRHARRLLNGAGIRLRGSTANLRAMANLARGTAERIDTGVPLTDALRESAANCGDPYFQMLAEDLAGNLVAESVPGNSNVTGYRIGSASVALRFPANFLLAICGEGAEAEEATRRRPSSELLMTLAELYEERASERTETIGVIWGMGEVLIIGLFVACIAAALFIPLVSMINSLSGW